MSLPHYFLALSLPNEVKQHIHQWTSKAKENLVFKKWVHPEDYHITLYFLGAVDDSQLDNIILRMKNAANSTAAFPLYLIEEGHFGTMERPRIFWVGVNRPENLKSLQQKVSNEMVSLGFREEKREYRPHITVARKWQEKESYQREITMIPSITPMDWMVQEFVLYKTHLHQEPKYEKVETFRFL